MICYDVVTVKVLLKYPTTYNTLRQCAHLVFYQYFHRYPQGSVRASVTPLSSSAQAHGGLCRLNSLRVFEERLSGEIHCSPHLHNSSLKEHRDTQMARNKFSRNPAQCPPTALGTGTQRATDEVKAQFAF